MYMCGLCRLVFVKLARIAKKTKFATKNDNLKFLQPFCRPLTINVQYFSLDNGVNIMILSWYMVSELD